MAGVEARDLEIVGEQALDVLELRVGERGLRLPGLEPVGAGHERFLAVYRVRAGPDLGRVLGGHAVLVVGAGRHGRVGSVGDGHVQQRLHVIDLIAGDGGIERAGMVFPVEPGEGGADLPELIGREILDGRLGGGVQRVCGGVRGRRGQRRRGQRDGRPGRQGDAQRDRNEPVPAVRAGADADDVPHIVSFSYGRGRMPRPPPPQQEGSDRCRCMDEGPASRSGRRPREKGPPRGDAHGTGPVRVRRRGAA